MTDCPADGDHSPKQTSQSLRERALVTDSANATSRTQFATQFTAEEGLKAIHELRVHQIELELQNEELRQSQLALEESRSRFLDLYNFAPVGFCLVSHSGVIHEANETLATMIGASQDSLNNSQFSKFVHEDDQDVLYLLRKRLLTASTSQTCELRLRKVDGTSTWVQLSASLTSGDSNSVSQRFALMDIDARIVAEQERASLEAQLREAQKMEAIGTLAGGVAHDFNNILAVIFGNTERALHLLGQSNTETAHCIEEIHNAAKCARELVKQILSFCRRQHTECCSLNLSSVVDDAVHLLRSTIPANIKITCNSANNVPNIFADYTQIEQVIINLATNAMQAFNGSPGEIRIQIDTIVLSLDSPSLLSSFQPIGSQSTALQTASPIVRLTFSDNGPGIDASVLQRVFEPFFTTKSIHEGTGLGLAVVHGIVRAHNGTIIVDSKLGEGTTFTICLPPATEKQLASFIESEDESTRQPQAKTLTPKTALDCTILYLDDDELVMRSVVRQLGSSGIMVHGYSDQATALEALSATTCNIDFVLTDYNMPGLSGLEFARKVREIRPDLAVVVTSGYIDDVLRSQADEAGVRALVPKPFSLKSIRNLIELILRPGLPSG